MRTAFQRAFHRAAAQSPLHWPCTVYETATGEDGRALVDASGTFVYRAVEETLGFLDVQAEDQFTTIDAPYQGDTALGVLTRRVLDLDNLVLMGGTLYGVLAVKGGDSAGVAIKVQAKAVDDPASVTLLGWADENPSL